MSNWVGARFQYGEKINSTHASLAKKDLERAEIEQLTAQYLLTKEITKVAYGVRSDVPKLDFEN